MRLQASLIIDRFRALFFYKLKKEALSMMIKQKVLDALNKQLNQELYASYLYLAMSAHFESASLTGFAAWMRAQSVEEYQHAMKIFDFIHQVDGKIELLKIDAPKISWTSPHQVIQEVYDHEKSVTASIYDLVDLAMSQRDHATTTFLQWFVNEQVEEESSALKVLERITLIGDNKNGLIMLDHELGSRPQ
jgi:ferritin